MPGKLHRGSPWRMNLRVAPVILLLLLASCASHGHPSSQAPAWVGQGPETLPGAGVLFLYGQGRAEPAIRNVPLSKVTAKERARVNLAFAVQSEIRSLLPLPGSERLIRPVVEAVLPHYRIVAMYSAPDGSRYALARLPYSELVTALRAGLADPGLIPPEEAPEMRDLLSRDLAARGLSESP